MRWKVNLRNGPTGMMIGFETWWREMENNEMDETLSYKTKPVMAWKRAKKGNKESEWMENCSVWISFTLIKALVDKVVWDYLNRDPQRERKRAQRERGGERREIKRQEERGRESCLINTGTALWQWVKAHIYQTSVKWRNPYGLA